MLHGRKRLAITLSGTLSGLVLATMISLVPSGSATADPSIDDVQARVDKLYHEAEQASERLNDAKISLRELRRDVTSLQADQDRQNTQLDAAHTNLRNSIISQYEGQSLSALGAVTDSDDPDAFVSKISTMSAFNDLQNQLFTAYATQAKALDLRAKATEWRTAEVAKAQASLVADKQEIDDKLAQAKELLGSLKEKERMALLSRSTTRLPSDVSASGRAAVALHFAMAQVGKAYVYGAAGPGAFDCSGLMMAAWGAAGVSLPHSSSAQYGAGPHVAASDLQPGDLVFYYSPISHVGMYIGNGLIVAAQNPSDGVRVVGLYSMPYAGAVRVG